MNERQITNLLFIKENYNLNSTHNWAKSDMRKPINYIYP